MSDQLKPNIPAFYPPSQTALLLLDYHNHIVNMIQPEEQKKAVTSSVSALVSTARANGVAIIHCLIDFTAEAPPSSKMKDRWDGTYKPLVASTPEAAHIWRDFLPDKSASDQEATVVKVPGCVSALKSLHLVDLLRNKFRVKSVVICGIVTSGAVLSTARDAADMGFVSTVVRDGCWDYSADSHRVVLDHVLPMSAWVVDLAEGPKYKAKHI
ncbi:hypothetical protein CDD80_4352 [Ophiocordyceps camponoti-rufipedis]|uniref:Isochorismatase-like domain-containing protein n=1 Tax=Ophiocordyceps camponoti-rufipedis TaxID=2004952 RepID=A0A2C5ZIE9_9HYPO|nr:hypothetical protein CDD80_4352 [Ophiocordyceps camponoti-rufipedis]